MNTKTTLVGLCLVCAALFAMPAIASAFPAHIDKVEAFTVGKVAGNETMILESSDGSKFECHGGITGSGAFETTTTGWIELAIHKCTTVIFGSTVSCTTHPGTAETITTTKLTFHKISTPVLGTLITPNHTTGVFAH